MRNVHLRVLLALVFTIVLAGTGCGRKGNPSKSDTTYTRKADSLGLKPKDSEAVKKVDTIIETAFVEIEKDCPNLPKEKLDTLKSRIKNSCTHESLSGGLLTAQSEDGKRKYEIVFEGNKATVHGYFQEPTITIKEECPPCKTKKQKLGFWDYLKLIGGGLLLLFVGIFIGKIL